MLFSILDCDGDELVAGVEGALFLRRSALPTDQLREVWRLASGGTSKAKLEKNDWLVACKLVASIQAKGGEPNVSAILNTYEAFPIADFNFGLDPEISESAHLTSAAGELDNIADLSPEAITVTVSNPTTYGSGLSKHTRYQVTCTTTLGHFPRKEMSVWRRFSDFEWLHERISTVFPATVIPMFPEKRVVGNSDADFIASRQALLQEYITRISRHPVLSESFDLLIFLDASDSGLENAKSFIEQVISDDSDNIISKSMDATLTAVGLFVPPPVIIKVDEAFIQACASHGATLARLSAVVKTGTSLLEAEARAASTCRELGRALIALASHERTFHDICGKTKTDVLSAAAASRKAAVVLLQTGGSNSSSAAFSSPVSGSGSTGGALFSGSNDSAAASAFANHHSASTADNNGSIGAMFANSATSDPYGSLTSGLQTSSNYNSNMDSSTSTIGGTFATDLPDVLTTIGNELNAAGIRASEQMTVMQEALLNPMKLERDKEAELGEAIKRRDNAIDKVTEANSALFRRKKAYASLKPTDKSYTIKAQAANVAIEKAEKTLIVRKDDLDRMTEALKGEMGRVTRLRRSAIVVKLAEYALLQATQSKERANVWNSTMPLICTDGAELDKAKEKIAGLARKAEAKARAASAAAKSKAASGGGGGVLFGLFGGSSGSAQSGAAAAAVMSSGNDGIGGLFADAAPIPDASEL
jgi:hypothetical protein